MSKNRELFRLTAVKALDESRLQLAYADGAEFVVDVTDWISSTTVLRAFGCRIARS